MGQTSHWLSYSYFIYNFLLNLYLSVFRIFSYIINFTMNQDTQQQTNQGLFINSRRNINQLSPDQRKRFVYCVKMLGILNAFGGDKVKNFTSLAPQGYNDVKPRCLQDSLISFYRSTNLLNTFASAYSNRHFLVVYEMFLNYAHYVLSMSVTDIVNKHPYIVYDLDGTIAAKKSAALIAVKTAYSNLQVPNSKIMAHYWNPTNYGDLNDISIPQEFKNIRSTIDKRNDPMNTLFELVNKHYPDQINPKTRWFDNPNNFDESTRQLQIDRLVYLKYFDPDFTGYTAKQQEVLNGTLDVRQNIAEFLKQRNSLCDFMSNEGTQRPPSTLRNSSKKNLDYFNDPQDGEYLIQLQNSDDRQYFVKFGGKKPGANLQYFQQSQIKPNIQQAQYTYNESLPHYQLAYSLYNTKYDNLPDFLIPFSGTSFEWSSRTVFQSLNFVNLDPSYGPTSFVFLLYLSWVDATFEMKLRMLTADPAQAQAQATIMYKFLTVNTYNSEYSQQNVNKYADFPIAEWTQSDGTPAKNFIMTFQDIAMKDSNNLRKSTDLYDIYKANYIDQTNIPSGQKGQYVLNIKRFRQYPNFINYNASYDYEISYVDQNGQKVKQNINDYIKSLNNYLKNMTSQVNSFDSRIYSFSTEVLHKPSYATRFTEIVQKGWLTYVKFNPSDPPHSHDRIDLKMDLNEFITQLQNSQWKKEYEDMINRWKAFIYENYTCTKKSPIILLYSSTLPIRKQKVLTNVGTDSKKNKHKTKVLINLTEQLFTRLRIDLWIDHFLMRHPQTIYETDQKKKPFSFNKIPNIHKIFLVNDHIKKNNPPGIDGAERAIFHINLQTDQIINDLDIQIHLGIKQILRADQHSKELGYANNNLYIDDIGNYTTSPDGIHHYNCYRFDFCNLKLQEIQDIDTIDGLMYYKASVYLQINGKACNFEFDITGYHILINYKFVARLQNGKVSVKITDNDYCNKLKFVKYLCQHRITEKEKVDCSCYQEKIRSACCEDKTQ